jgi:hypothetical protein
MPTRRDVLVGSVLAGLSVALPRLAGASEVVVFSGELEVVRIDAERIRVRAWVVGDGDVVLVGQTRTAAVSILSLEIDGKSPETLLLGRPLTPPGCTSRASPRRLDVVVTQGMRLGSAWQTTAARPGAVLDAVVSVRHQDGGAELRLAGEAPPLEPEPDAGPTVPPAVDQE